MHLKPLSLPLSVCGLLLAIPLPSVPTIAHQCLTPSNIPQSLWSLLISCKVGCLGRALPTGPSGTPTVVHDVLFHDLLLLLSRLQTLVSSLEELFLLGHLGSQMQEFLLYQLSLRRRDTLRQSP